MQDVFHALVNNGFKVSTDTRQNVAGTIFFALKGDNFDGSQFVDKALEGGALAVVTENKSLAKDRVHLVDSVLKSLQELASLYRSEFQIPVLAIGGSNGKTTTRELVNLVLKTKFKTHSSQGNLNNHIGLPLSILSMPKDTEIGVFEIGANHPQEHTDLLKILKPTLTLITNNGLDHLEGFGSPEGVRLANKEIYDWARLNKAKALVNKLHSDQVADSLGVERSLYWDENLKIESSYPLTISFSGNEFEMKMVGDYNLENIQSAVAVGSEFGVLALDALEAISHYLPDSKRSQLIKLGSNTFVVDCYNANPSSMTLALQSFAKSKFMKKSVILGDMLELGDYALPEHKKILDLVSIYNFDEVILIGSNFKKAGELNSQYHYFDDSEQARTWFIEQDFQNQTFLLKGSRGMKVERVIER